MRKVNLLSNLAVLHACIHSCNGYAQVSAWDTNSRDTKVTAYLAINFAKASNHLQIDHCLGGTTKISHFGQVMSKTQEMKRAFRPMPSELARNIDCHYLYK